MQNSQQTETRTAIGFDVHKFSPDGERSDYNLRRGG